MKQNFFIALEGIDGSGKTTLARALAGELQQQGHDVVLTKEPGATPLGRQVRALLDEYGEELDPVAEILLFAADRAQHYAQVIIPACNAGAVVIADRTGDSSIAYQGYGRGLDIDMITTLNRWTTRGVQPDLTLYVQVDYETALARVHRRGAVLTKFEKEHHAFFERVITGFETLYAHRPDVITLDGSLSQDMITAQARDVVLAAMERKCNE